MDDLESVRREINEYLAVEWGHTQRLSHVGAVEDHEVFEFEDYGTRYFALGGRHFRYVRAGRMSLDDLQTQEHGRAWLAARDPIDEGTSRLGDERVPTAIERRHALRALVATAGFDADATTIVEGLFLVEDGRYVALIESSEGERFTIIDGAAQAVPAELRGVAAWQSTPARPLA